jgi:hypothetical protein
MRHHPESTVEHTHVYLQRGTKDGIDSTHELLLERCLKSLERHLFYPGKTFANATPQDIDVTSSIGLIRHRRKEMPESQIRSFWTKGFSIPLEYQSYYPPLPTACLLPDVVPFESSGPVRKKGRKSQHSDTMKIVTKHLLKPTAATTVSNLSIARFFSPSATVCSTPITLGPAKVSKEPMIWHQEVSPIDEEDNKEYEWGEAEGSVLFGEGSSLVGEGSALVGEGSALVGEDSAVVEAGSSSPLVGECSALVGESSAICGEGSGLLGDLLGERSAPPMPRGHVVLQRKGNIMVTGPAPSRYKGIKPNIAAFFPATTTTSSTALTLTSLESVSTPTPHKTGRLVPLGVLRLCHLL